MKKEKLVKFPKKYQYGWRIAGDPANWDWLFNNRFFSIRYPLWVKRPICWFTKHQFKIYWPYGIKIKQCQKCAKRQYKKRTTEKGPNLYKGEVGQLYGIRFVSTKKSKPYCKVCEPKPWKFIPVKNVKKPVCANCRKKLL